MKRHITIGIALLFLTQVMIGFAHPSISPTHEEKSDICTSKDLIPTKNTVPTNNTFRNNDPVVTWSDDFQDSSKINWSDNVTISDGKVKLGPNSLEPDENTVALWHFDEGTGVYVQDSSGNGNHGTLQNMSVSSWVNTEFGKGLRFDGDNDHVKIPHSEDLNLGNQFTIEAWVKKEEDSRYQAILSKGTYDLKIGNDETVQWTICNGSSEISYLGRLDPAIMFLYAMVVFDGKLYAGIATTSDEGYLYRYDGGTSWTRINRFGTSKRVCSLLVHNNKLYAGLSEGDIYEYDRNSWSRVTQYNNVKILSMATYHQILYVGTSWGTLFSYDGETWEGIGSIGNNNGARTMVVFDGNLYTGAGNGKIFRYDGGTTWTEVGSPTSGRAESLCVYNNKLYVIKQSNANVYRYDGENSWSSIGNFGGGNQDGFSLVVYNGEMYGSCGNSKKIYRYDGGTTWTEIGDLDSNSNLHVVSLLVYDGKLLCGLKREPKVYSMGEGISVYSEKTLSKGFSHIVARYDGSCMEIFINGSLVGQVQKNIPVVTSTFDLLIGGFYGSSVGGTCGSGEEFFKGIIDEVSISNRAISHDEINRHSQLYIANGTLKTKNILVPSGKLWKSFKMNGLVPNNTYLNITLHDFSTGEILHTIETQHSNVDISHIDSYLHPAIYIKAAFQSNRTQTPILSAWEIECVHADAPELTDPIDDLRAWEDTPTDNLLDLADNFFDGYALHKQPVYSIEYLSDQNNITSEINASLLQVIDLVDNWTGAVSIIVNCTNVYGITTSSNMFDIIVYNKNDAPVWASKPPPIEFDEDTEYISQYSLNDYVFDCDGDTLEFEISCEDEKLTLGLTEDNHITITPDENHTVETTVSVILTEVVPNPFQSSIDIPIAVIPINDAPVPQLVAPEDGKGLDKTEVTFMWDFFDADDEDSNITSDLYLGKDDPPHLHTSGIAGNTVKVSDLKRNSTYFWYVKCSDGKNCSDSCEIRRFYFTGIDEPEPEENQMGIDIDVDIIEIAPGQSRQFNINFTNMGLIPVTAVIKVVGTFANDVLLPDGIVLESKQTAKELLTLTVPATLPVGNYDLIINVSYAGVSRELIVPVKVVQPVDSNGGANGGGSVNKGSGSSSWLWILIVAILIVAVVVIVVVLRQKRKGKEETDASSEPQVSFNAAQMPQPGSQFGMRNVPIQPQDGHPQLYPPGQQVGMYSQAPAHMQPYQQVHPPQGNMPVTPSPMMMPATQPLYPLDQHYVQPAPAPVLQAEYSNQPVLPPPAQQVGNMGLLPPPPPG